MVGAPISGLSVITPALLTSSVTSAQSRATAATCAGSVMSRATGMAGPVTVDGSRAAA